jgi:protein involved in polysaccharide export with SLBB domain
MTISMLRRIVCALALALVWSLPAGAQESPTGDPAAIATVSLRPGDVLRIEIWREPDLTGEYLVDEVGEVTLPLLGTRRVTGQSVRDLRDTLIEEYRVHLRNPSISIIPLRRINVLGEVARPGLYSVDPTVSLAGAVALAGGATQNGDLNRVRIIRGGETIRERVGAGETLSTLDVQSGDQVIVDRRSWFERNSTFVVSMLISVTSIAISLVR